MLTLRHIKMRFVLWLWRLCEGTSETYIVSTHLEDMGRRYYACFLMTHLIAYQNWQSIAMARLTEYQMGSI